MLFKKSFTLFCLLDLKKTWLINKIVSNNNNFYFIILISKYNLYKIFKIYQFSNFLSYFS